MLQITVIGNLQHAVSRPRPRPEQNELECTRVSRPWSRDHNTGHKVRKLTLNHYRQSVNIHRLIQPEVIVQSARCSADHCHFRTTRNNSTWRTIPTTIENRKTFSDADDNDDKLFGTTSSADADKPAWRLQRSVKVTKHSTIPYARYSFLLVCKRNFVFKTCSFSDIWLRKCHDIEIRVRGHSRSLKMVTFDRLSIVSYQCYAETLSLRHFRDNWLQKCRDLENRVRGPSKSLEMSPCDRVHMTSYLCSIVTVALSNVVSEIFNVEKCCDLEIGVRGHPRSLKVAPFDRLCMISYYCSFSNFVSKMRRFWDIRLVSIQWHWNPG